MGTESDPTDLPNWFGHSVNTITNHPNDPTADNPFAWIDNDDTKNNGANHLGDNKKYKPNHQSFPTQDIVLFADDDDTTSSNGVNKDKNLSPSKASSLKSRHNASKSTGLIAPPRSKGDKPKKIKKRVIENGETIIGNCIIYQCIW